MLLSGVHGSSSKSYQFATRERNESASAPAGDRFQASSNDTQAYILMPPKNTGLFKMAETVDRIQQVENTGGEVKEELSIVGGYVASLNGKQAEQLEKQGWRVVPDEVDQFLPPIPGLDDDSADGAASADKPKEEKPVEKYVERKPLEAPRFSDPFVDKFQGEGIGVAILDTGVYPHPDFVTPYNRLVAFVDMVEGRSIPYDDNGHGTHCAGDAAGSGLMSGGLYRGLAPKANIIGVKVLAGSGSGKTSDIIKGLEWCIKHKDEVNLRVINMSLGHKARKKYEEDPVDMAVKAAHDAGLVVVAAAGNEGPDRKTVCAPGDSPYAITVGAVDDKNTADPSDDKVTDFSSRGPTPAGLQKPDVMAPGEAIYAPLAPGTDKEASSQRSKLLHESLKFWSEQPHEVIAGVPREQFQLMGLSAKTINNLKESPEKAENEFNRLLRATSRTPLSENGAYQALPGTSMATPIVSGLVVQMLEANPDLTPDQVKKILVDTADPLPGRVGKNTQGAGMIDPREAIMVALHTQGERKAEEEAPAQPAPAAEPAAAPAAAPEAPAPAPAPEPPKA